MIQLPAWIPTHMDYEGQRRAERLFQVIIVLFGAVGLAWGYSIQQFSQTVYILGAGVALACLLALPPWPMYRRRPISWQKPRTEAGDTSSKKTKKK